MSATEIIVRITDVNTLASYLNYDTCIQILILDITNSMFLYRDIGEVDKHILQLTDTGCILYCTEATES